jgi:hypothetical protein
MELVFGMVALAGLLALLARRGRKRAQAAREQNGPDLEAGAADEDETEDWQPDEVVQVPIDGTLDLHHYAPREVGELVDEYLDACRERDILDVRIVHGKGKGVLRKTVWARLERNPAVAHFELAGHGGGSWGATEVRLHPRLRA